MKRSLLLLQVPILALVAFTLAKVVRLEREVDGLRRSVSLTPSGGTAPRDRPDPASLLSELRAACDEYLAAVRDPVEQRVAEKRVKSAVDALSAAGAAGFDALVAAFDTPGPAQFRERLLEAMEAADRGRAAAFALQVLERGGEDSGVRMRAAYTLMSADSDRAIPALVEILRRESEATFPPLGELVTLLGERGGATVVKALLDLIARPDRGRSAAYRAVEVLGRRRAPEAAGALRLTVVSEPVDHILRRKAVQALVEIEGRGICTFLEECASREKDEHFRLFLEDTLAKRCR